MVRAAFILAIMVVSNKALNLKGIEMNTDQPVLVTYATRSGSTVGVAEAIAKTLAERGTPVVVRPMNEVKDLSPYAAVIAGSAIQGQKWLPEALRFVKDHRSELSRKPFAAFMVCISLSMKNIDQYRQSIEGWMAPVRSLVRPVKEGYFAGMLDFRKMPFSLNTLMMRLPVLFGMWRLGDHRDWTAIRRWAEAVHPLLVK